MTDELVLEIGALCTDSEADAVIEYAVDHRHAGVVVKGSQGARWIRANARQLLSDAQSSGLQGAWLHYCEPVHNAPETEAAELVSATAGLPLGLGVWVEVERQSAGESFALADWLKVLVDSVSIPSRPVALVVEGGFAYELSAVLQGARVVYLGGEIPTAIPGWAERTEGDVAINTALTVPGYLLASTRGLVPPGSPVAAAGATATVTADDAAESDLDVDREHPAGWAHDDDEPEVAAAEETETP